MRQGYNKEATMARDEYDHLRESADAAKEQFVLVDQINSQAFGPFDSEKAAQDAARTGDDQVGGVPWGEDGWEVVTLQVFKQDHDDEGIAYTDVLLAAGRKSVIDEIVNEIGSGNAHLMTRNEVSDFVNWLLSDTDMTDKIYDALNQGTDHIERSITDEWAKAYFVKCEYEKA